MGIACAEVGGISARFSQTLPVSFDEKQEAEVRKGGLKYRNYFRLRPGKYRLKLAASDNSSHAGSSELFLEVPSLSNRELASSSIVITEQASRLPDQLRSLKFDENQELLEGILKESAKMFRLFFATCPIPPQRRKSQCTGG